MKAHLNNLILTIALTYYSNKTKSGQNPIRLMRSLILHGLMSLILIQTATWACAQSVYIISGKVTDVSQKPLPGATVFIDGSQIATATDITGQFKLIVPGPGSYQLSVKMLGYAAANKDMMLKEQSANVTFMLAVKAVILNQVNIGADKNWAQYFEIFKKQFLGTTPNALACKIMNPEVINFSTKQNMLYADADEFLIIENLALGYHIKYLLKSFRFNKIASRTSYNGQVIFEELPGDAKQKQQWAKNRLQAYEGSLTHFLRAVFTNTTLQEGFIASPLVIKNNVHLVERRPVKFDTIVTAIDTNFISLKFNGLYVLYDRKAAAELLNKPDTSSKKPEFVFTDVSKSAIEAIKAGKSVIQSELIPYSKDIVVDAKGRVSGDALLSFLIRGYWTYRRVGDQLPFEYEPPVKSSATP